MFKQLSVIAVLLVVAGVLHVALPGCQRELQPRDSSPQPAESQEAAAKLQERALAEGSQAQNKETALGDRESAAPADGYRVVELFTSQGCSSCPPADDLLAELSDEEDLLTLSFHVDYWNYLGWQDPWSSERWSMRQRRYAKRLSGRVYTPMMVINGGTDVVGSREGVVAELLEDARVLPRVEIQTREEAGRATIEAQMPEQISKSAVVEAFAILDRATNEVTSGENHGRDLSHRQIVDKPVEVVMDGGEVHGELDSNGIDQVILLVWEGEELVAAGRWTSGE